MDYSKLGVYRIGNLSFRSKFEAIEMHARTGIHPHWDFNEAVFSCYDWTKEPKDSILELYKKRAEQIRNSYDYICLLYSSGADSQNILDTFIHNDIKLDEVVNIVSLEGEKTSSSTPWGSWANNAEILSTAIPKIKELQQTRPWLKHRILDLTDYLLECFSQTNLDIPYLRCSNLTPRSFAKDYFVTRVDDWRKLTDKGQRVCIMIGTDKPRVHHINGKFVFKFLDIWGYSPGVDTPQDKKAIVEELFYWSPDLPELLIKQAHLIKNYLSQPNIENFPGIKKDGTELAYIEVNGEKYGLTNNGLHSIIYPTWDLQQQLTSCPKPDSSIFAGDLWFHEKRQSLHYQNWLFGVEKIWKTVPDYWKNDPTNIEKGIKGCWSKNYYLN